MRFLKVLFVMGMLTLALAACSAPQQTAAPTVTMEVVASPEPAATVTAPEAAVVEPTETAAPTEIAAEDYCVNCHTDKDQLINTARPEEVKVKESEGAG